jgi:hypothetical protein
MKLAIVVGALACALAVPRVADACRCDDSRELLISPPPDSVLPPSPTLYVFVPNSQRHVIPMLQNVYVSNTATSAPITTVRTTQVAIDPEHIVYRVEVDASEGVLDVHLTYGKEHLAFSFVIGREPPVHRFRPLELMFHEMTDCGTTDEKSVTLRMEGNAVAYELTWDDGAKTMIPPTDVFHDAHDVRIGARCGTTNVAYDRLHDSHAITLHALYADGAERTVGTSKLQLSRLRVRSPIELLDARASAANESTPAREPRTYYLQATANPTGSSIAGGAACGVTLVVGAALWRARRRRHAARL